MPAPMPSAMITDNGDHVHLRVHGRLYELGQDELRRLLGLPPGAKGLGITVNGDRFHFEFVADEQEIELSEEQLRRRLAKQLTANR